MKRVLAVWVELLLLPLYFLSAWRARHREKLVDIGLGPMPIISNQRLCEALRRQGFTAETFVYNVFYISAAFDLRLDQLIRNRSPNWRKLRTFRLICTRYRTLHLFFDGLLGNTEFIWRFEPALLRLAGVKTIISPQGTDLYDLASHSNLLLKHCLVTDYPNFKYRRKLNGRRLQLWTEQADHIIGGCDWVDQLFHWDTLVLNTFCIPTDVPNEHRSFDLAGEDEFIILHAPNHRNTKGTRFLEKAVSELKAEGYRIVLDIAEKVPNETVQQRMRLAHVVADQFVIGWYAIFTLEALAMGKPVLCYLREDLVEFYQDSGVVEPDEIPIVSTSRRSIKEKLRRLYHDSQLCHSLSERSRAFVHKYHSLEAIGTCYTEIQKRLGCFPSRDLTRWNDKLEVCQFRLSEIAQPDPPQLPALLPHQ